MLCRSLLCATLLAPFVLGEDAVQCTIHPDGKTTCPDEEAALLQTSTQAVLRDIKSDKNNLVLQRNTHKRKHAVVETHDEEVTMGEIDVPLIPLSFLEMGSDHTSRALTKNATHGMGRHSIAIHGLMHNLQHASTKSLSAKGKMVEEFRSSLSPSLLPSSFLESRVILAFLCALLVASSALLNTWKKNDKFPDDLPTNDHYVIGKGLSTLDATVATFSAIFGMGVLSLPYAMSLAGWFGVILIFAFTGCAAYTGHILTLTLQQESARIGSRFEFSWGSLLEVTYGRKARRAVNVFLVVELWGYLLSGIVAASMTLNQLLTHLNSAAAVGIVVLVQFVLATMQTKLLARLNAVCNVFFVACCLMFIVTGLLLPAKESRAEPEIVKPHGVLAACGVVVFSPAAHSLYPAIMQRMEQPERYPTCLRRAYLLACIVYVCVAVLGYWLFGNDVQPSAVMNIGVDRKLAPLPNLGWMNHVAAFSVFVKVSGLQPLIMVPLSSTIEGMVTGLMPERVVSILVVPVVLTVSAVAALHFADNIAALLDVVGSIFCMNIAFVLPTLCYWRINEHSVGFGQQLLFSAFILLGGFFACSGLTMALGS